MTTSKKTKIIVIVLFVLMVSWAMVIFHFSLQTADTSSKVSRGLLSQILNLFYDITKIRINPLSVHKLFRKFAHFTEFFIFGIFAVSFFFLGIKKRPIYALLCGALVATCDEIIQFFTGSGRAMRIGDILIDTSGVIFASLLFYIFWRIIIKKKKIVLE